MQDRLWLTVLIDEFTPSWPSKLDSYTVEIAAAKTIHKHFNGFRYRTSPIFPLKGDSDIPKLDSCSIYFYFFDSAFPVLGRIKDVGSDKLTGSTWYSAGLASIILITNDGSINDEFLSSQNSVMRSSEIWKIENSKITDISISVSSDTTFLPSDIEIPDYSCLPNAELAIVDEFVASLTLIMPKIATHIPSELGAYYTFVDPITELIIELIYLSNPQGPPPKTLEEYDEETLRNDRTLCNQLKQQVIDRLIQVNSALSYVSTQMLSGSPPILERRSLIRRHSLLGTGTASLALIRIARSIEMAFSRKSIEDIITDYMASARPLPGLAAIPNYDSSRWQELSIHTFEEKAVERPSYPKLAYFSGRLGYRETEYTISAAFQALTCGSQPAWSLLTITHEMLHGYVRNLLSIIFLGDSKQTEEKNWEQFYQTFSDFVLRKAEASTLLDSLRIAILAYCCLTRSFGSLTTDPCLEGRGYVKNGKRKHKCLGHGYYLLFKDELRTQYEDQYRNISEIFTHVLDLHYFYASRIDAYIPLIWLSWAEHPHVNADLRQYLLRSLLAISVKLDGDPHHRFLASIDRFKEIFSPYLLGIFNVPLIHKALGYLGDRDLCEELFYPYWSSILLVDLVDNIFVSHQIRNDLFSDDFVDWVKNEGGFEEQFRYNLPDGFSEEQIVRPTAFLLDRFLNHLNNPSQSDDVEAETTRLFLAICSNSRT